MTDPSVNTVKLHLWLDRMRAGDLSARDELLRCFWNRLERLARRMFRGYPGVSRWAQAADVLQNAVLRLLRALRQVRPRSVSAFFGLAAEQIRRELLDLARHFHGPLGPGTHHAPEPPGDDPPSADEDLAELERWSALHDGIARLPAVEREVVSLTLYHGWSQAEVAKLMGVTVRTVQRRWESALRKLRQALGGEGTAA
jgi:RNA polymerase sigma-70 factor (ECF subfamily)